MFSKYEIIYVTQKAVKGSVIASQLVENAINDYEPLDFKFPNEDIIEIDEVET